MHIALVRRFCSLKKAGAERYCVNLFRQLQKLGHQVTIVGEGIDDELRDEVDFLPVPVTQWTSWTKNQSFADNVAQVVKTRRFDVVHGLSRANGLDTYRLTDPLQTHWINIYYRHPVERWIQHLNPRHRTILNIERRLYESGQVRRVITQSKLDTRLLTEYFRIPEDRIRRIPNGVNLSVFRPEARTHRAEIREQWKIDADEPLLVFASMDFRRKGLGTLLQALATLHQKVGFAESSRRTKSVSGERFASQSLGKPYESHALPGASGRATLLRPKLLVLGDGDVRRYQQKAKELGLEREVIFAGRQSGIEKYYGAADLFVLPTIYEPFPNVNLEAMACGLPVITTKTAGGADIVVPGENGFLIDNAWAVNQLTESIAQFFELSTADRDRMSRCCIETARKFTVEENALQTVRVLEEVLREKSRV